MNGLPADYYQVNVEYIGNNIFNPASDSIEVLVEENDPGLNVTVNGTQLNITLDKNVTLAEVHVKVPDEEYERTFLWWLDPLIVDLSDLAPGTYSIDVFVPTDGYYADTSVTVNMTVPEKQLKDPGLTLTPVRNGMVVSFTEENVTGILMYTGDDEMSEGEFIYYNNTPFLIDLNGFEPDEYPIAVKYLGNDVYSSTYNFDVVTVERNDPELNVTVNGTQLTITLNKNVSIVEILVTVPGEDWERSFGWWGDPIIVDLSELAPGKYTIDVGSLTDGYYSGSYTTVNVTVKRAASAISVSADTINYGEDLVVNVQLPFDAARRAVVTVGDESKLVSLKNGAGSVRFSGLPAGTYNITASYNGDSKYLKSSASVIAKVKKSSSGIQVAANAIQYGEDLVINIQGPSDISRRVSITVGNESKIVSLKNGVASVKFIGLAAGTYDIIASYNGDSNYLKSLVNTTVKVSKATPEIQVIGYSITYAETLTIHVQLPGDVSKRATVTIDNVTKAVTLKNGTGSIKFTDLGVGTHEVQVSYAGDANYKKASTATRIELL